MLDVASFTFEFDMTQADFRQWETAVYTYLRGHMIFVLILTLILDVMRNQLLTSVAWLTAERFLLRPLDRLWRAYYVHAKQPRAWVRLDEHGLIYVTRPNRRVQERSMAQLLLTNEFAEFFSIKSSWGIFCIPKRAFASDSQIEHFRRFLRERLGSRCRFAVA